MAFATLKASDHFFAAEAPRLKELHRGFPTAGSITEIMLEPAREALRSDLLRAWALDPLDASELAEFERLALLVPANLEEALAAKQLELLYLSQAGGADGLNYRLYQTYRARYLELIGQAPTWGYVTGLTTIGSVRQMI
jgi:hypothetical protein